MIKDKKEQVGCGKIMYGNKSDGEICCGDDKAEWNSKIKEFIKIGIFMCDKCKEKI